MKLMNGLVLVGLFTNVILSAQDTLQNQNKDTLINKTNSNAAQQDSVKSENPGYNEFSGTYDKIKLESGDSIIVNIIAETQTEIAFRYPLNTMINKLIYGKIKEIIYKDGKVKAFKNQTPATGVGAEPDNLWRIVVITQDESEVAGLKQIGPITAKAEGKNYKSSLELLEKNARVNLQRKAVRMNATKVLVTNKYVEQAYGEIPSVEYEGIAYGPQ